MFAPLFFGGLLLIGFILTMIGIAIEKVEWLMFNYRRKHPKPVEYKNNVSEKPNKQDNAIIVPIPIEEFREK